MFGMELIQGIGGNCLEPFLVFRAMENTGKQGNRGREQRNKEGQGDRRDRRDRAACVVPGVGAWSIGAGELGGRGKNPVGPPETP